MTAPADPVGLEAMRSRLDAVLPAGPTNGHATAEDIALRHADPLTSPTNRGRMVRAAVWLAEQGFAEIGWAHVFDGKAPKRRWKSDATADPGMVPELLRAGGRNALVIPIGRAIIIDVDRVDVWPALEAEGLPPTFTVDSRTPGHGHIYGFVPRHIDMRTIPGVFDGGEIRRWDPSTATASMVLGPWAETEAGTYRPREGARQIAELPVSVIEYLVRSAHHQDAERSAARGPDDPGWKITQGRHDFLVRRARNLRGVGLSGERLFDELVRLDRERCSPPIADVRDRGVTEIRKVAEWIEDHIEDDPPDIVLSAATAHIPAAERNGSAPIDSAATPVVAAASIPLRFRTAREMAAELPVEVIWCVFPWVVMGGITEVVGKIKSAGKTTLVMAMCRAVLDGLPFLGETTTKTAVVYLTEQPPSSLREALRRADLLERDDFSLLTWRDTAGHKWPDIVRAAVAECARRGAGLLVVDTLGRFAGLRGDAENNAAEADAVMAELQIAAADGLSVIVIRHERKSGGDVGESGRGSSAYGGAVDIVLAVRRGEGNTRNTIRVIHALSRFDDTPETLAIELTDEGYVARGNEAAVAIEEAVDALREALPSAGSGGLTTTEVELLLKTRFGRTTIQEAMKRLLEAGELERTGAGKKGDPYRHAIRSAALSEQLRRDEFWADMADEQDGLTRTFEASADPLVNERVADELLRTMSALLGDPEDET